MKKQIRVVPMLAIMMFTAPEVDRDGNPLTFPKFL
jgi:hypothetical protein